MANSIVNPIVLPKPDRKPQNESIFWKRGPEQLMNENSNKNYFRLRNWPAVQAGNETAPYYDVIVTFTVDDSNDVLAEVQLISSKQDHGTETVKLAENVDDVDAVFNEEEQINAILTPIINNYAETACYGIE